MRNKRKTLHGKMILALEKFKIHFSQFVHSIFFHFSILLYESLKGC